MPVATSDFPPIDVPNVDIWNFLFENKERPFPDDKIIFIDSATDRSYTYAQTKAAALDFGKGLRSIYNWKKGDVLGLFTPNCIDSPAITWGTHWAGGVVSPANPGYTAEELAYQLKDSGARMLGTQIPMLAVARKAAKMVGLDESMIFLIGDQRDKQGKFKHFTSIRNISGATRYRKTKVDPKKDLAFLVYSSGTTGVPKGVMLSHRNVVANLMQIKVGEQGNLTWNKGIDGTGDCLILTLPAFHIYGLTAIVHHAFYAGLRLVFLPKFDVDGFCSTIQKYRCTFLYIVPPIALLLAKHPNVSKYDFSSVRMISSGAAPLTKELVDAVYARLKIPMKQAYGLSETSPSVHIQFWEEWDKTMGSVGHLLPSMEAKYMSTPDPAATEVSEPVELPIGETGELWLRGPNIFLGYHNNETATKNALTDDGWFKTGDVGFQDKDGNFYITDRVKELIKYKGFQVPPAELEGLLLSHEMISDVAVVGVEMASLGTEVPRAYVVPSVKYGGPGAAKKMGAKEEKEIQDWLAQRMANHKRLRGGVKFVEEIPKSTSGKILRRVLKDKARQELQMEEGKSGKAKL